MWPLVLAASFYNPPSSLSASRLRTTHQPTGTRTLECSPNHPPAGTLSEDSLWWQPDQDMALSTRGSRTWLHTQGLAARDPRTHFHPPESCSLPCQDPENPKQVSTSPRTTTDPAPPISSLTLSLEPLRPCSQRLWDPDHPLQ